MEAESWLDAILKDEELRKLVLLAGDTLEQGLLAGKYEIDVTHWNHQRWDEFLRWFARDVAIITHLGRWEQDLLKAVVEGGDLPEPVRIKVPVRFASCPECGQDIEWFFDGKRLSHGEPCPYPEGLPPYSVELDFPSGKMVFANDFRQFYEDELPEKERHLRDNGRYASKIVFDSYGSIGMGHGYVGNSCPNVYRRKDGRVVIGNPGYIWGTEANGWEDTELPLEGEEVGGICTDLWWYSVADAADLKGRGLDFTNEWVKNNISIVEVEPGRYRLTHIAHTINMDDTSKPRDYAILERIGDC